MFLMRRGDRILDRKGRADGEDSGEFANKLKEGRKEERAEERDRGKREKRRMNQSSWTENEHWSG
jgi:hypothetical protein